MRKLIIAGLILVLTACGSAAPTTGNTGATPVAQTPEVLTVQPVTSTTSVPASGTTGSATDTGTLLGAGTVEAKAAESVSEILNVPVDQLRLVNKVEQEWSDSSLGCPEGGSMYLQVITPGFLMTYTDGTNSYEVHTDATGERAVICENGAPRTTS